MIQLSLLLVIVMCLLTGCATSQGLSRDRLEAVLRQEESRFAGMPSSGNPTQPSAPVLGLYLKPTGFLHREFEWSVRDRDMMLTWSQQVSLGSAVRSAGFVTMSSLKGDSLNELRASAARYGIDWLLIVEGAAAVDRYNNYKAPLLYWTIFGAYLADGTHSDALCLVKGDLMGRQNGFPAVVQTGGRPN